VVPRIRDRIEEAARAFELPQPMWLGRRTGVRYPSVQAYDPVHPGAALRSSRLRAAADPSRLGLVRARGVGSDWSLLEWCDPHLSEVLPGLQNGERSGHVLVDEARGS
jgi:hypothetical protein